MHGGFFKAAAGVMPLVKRGEEPQQNKRTASFEKVAASDMTLAATWRSGRDSNPRTAFDRHTISNRARYDHFDTTAHINWKSTVYIIPAISALVKSNLPNPPKFFPTRDAYKNMPLFHHPPTAIPPPVV